MPLRGTLDSCSSGGTLPAGERVRCRSRRLRNTAGRRRQPRWRTRGRQRVCDRAAARRTAQTASPAHLAGPTHTATASPASSAPSTALVAAGSSACPLTEADMSAIWGGTASSAPSSETRSGVQLLVCDYKLQYAANQAGLVDFRFQSIASNVPDSVRSAYLAAGFQSANPPERPHSSWGVGATFVSNASPGGVTGVSARIIARGRVWAIAGADETFKSADYGPSVSDPFKDDMVAEFQKMLDRIAVG